jgi:hypothetical protein
VPTAGQYDIAASRFHALARRWDEQAGASAPTMLDFAEGPVRDELDDRIGAALDALASAGDPLRNVAIVCGQRAEVCRQYTHDVAAYIEHQGLFDFGVSFPQPPFPWVEL